MLVIIALILLQFVLQYDEKNVFYFFLFEVCISYFSLSGRGSSPISISGGGVVINIWYSA